MAADEFSAERCEELFVSEKFLASKIVWKPDGNDIYRFVAKVLTVDGVGLDLFGHWQKNGKHDRTVWGFSLRYYGHCIRSYDMALSHKNPGERGRIRGPHKHRYSSSKIDRLAYKPDPPISEADVNAALMDFLTEANIQRPASYQPFRYQNSLKFD